jgi:hypothetical protein
MYSIPYVIVQIFVISRIDIVMTLGWGWGALGAFSESVLWRGGR